MQRQLKLLFSIPQGMNAFEELNDFKLYKQLYLLGYDRPTPVQKHTVPVLQKRLNVIVTSPTGSGKTGAFAISSYLNVDQRDNNIQIIIISPTRELCQQTAEQIKLITRIKTIQCTNSDEYKNLFQQVKHQCPQIVVITINKLKQLLKQSVLHSLKYIIIDEADEIVNKPEVTSFVEQLNNKYSNVNYAFFSATYCDNSLTVIKSLVNIQKEIFIEQNQDQQPVQYNIKQYALEYVDKQDKLDYLIHILQRILFIQAIIFTNSHSSTQVISQFLFSHKIKNVELNSKLPITNRISNLKQFQSGQQRVLVSTDLFGRGMDVRGVNLIINYDIPNSKQQFIHRSGRCGRFGRQGTVVNLVNESEMQQILQWCADQGWELQAPE